MITKTELKDFPKFIGSKYAERLGLSKYQFRKFTQEKNSPSVRIGAKYYLDRDRLYDYLEEQERNKQK